MSNYKIKVDKELINKLKKYHIVMTELEDIYYRSLGKLEELMEKDTKIEGIYFFRCDGEYVGIGNYDTTMPLIHTEQLEKE